MELHLQPIPELKKELKPKNDNILFSIDAKTHGPWLKPIFSVINRSAVIPILECVYIRAENNRICFTTTDIDNRITYDIDALGVKNFELCINAGQIANVLYNRLDEETQVDFSIKDNRAVMQSGYLRVRVPFEDAKNYPRPQTVDENKKREFYIHTQDLIPFLKRAYLFTSNDDLRPSMTGVCFLDYNDRIYIAATDAHRLYYYPITKKTPSSLKGMNIIVEKRAIKIITEMFRDEDIKIEFDDSFIIFRSVTENKTICSKLIDARFPEIERLIPEYQLKFYMQRKKMIPFLKVAEHFVGNDNAVQFNVSYKKIEFEGNDSDFGHDFYYSLPIVSPSVTFQDFKFGVNIKFLKQIFETSKDEYLMISHSTEPMKAFVIDDCILLMPLMLRDGHS